MRQNYILWLKEQKYSDSTQTAQIHRVRKVEEHYGDLDAHFASGSYDSVIDNLQYSTSDERQNKPNPSKIKFEGNIRNNLQSYKNAVVRYLKFLNDSEFHMGASREEDVFLEDGLEGETAENNVKQRFSLERDMQAALRQNIKSLGSALSIIDDGAERAVDSGLIDIMCEDKEHIVVVELKAGKADSRAIGQILGYMGDINEEEEKSVRGILVAHDFDKRARAAARVVPTLKLMKYTIEFKFEGEE